MEVLMPMKEEGGGRVQTWWRSLEGCDGLGRSALGWTFLAVMLLLCTRRPDLLLHPQFYAEDGAIWYAQAYNLGWLHSMAIPDGGYLNSLQRLGAGVTLLFPFFMAPLLMNLLGMMVQVLPANALLSRRCATWGPLPMRVVMAAIYIAVPNAQEIHVVLTNSQWHLALLAVLIAFGAPPKTWKGKVLDVALFLIFSISGPFPLLLVPLMLVFWWVRRADWTLVQLAFLLPGTLLQAYFLHTTVRIAPMPLGASPVLLLRIVSGDIFLSAMVGSNYHTGLLPVPVLMLVLVMALAIIAFGCWRGGVSLTLFTIFSVLTLAGGLKSPLIAGPHPLWVLLLSDVGARYWFYPMMVFLWSGVVAAFAADPGAKWFRWTGRALLSLLLVGVVRQWIYPPYTRHEFRPYAEQFEHLQPGQSEVIPIYPEGTVMIVRKH
jgi:hypothetical protein